MGRGTRRWLVLGALALLATPEAGARREGADGRYEERRSSHFILLQDVDIDRRTGWHGSRQFELGVLETLEAAHDDVDARLGLRLRRPVQVVVHDPEVFDRRFAGLFRFPVGGFHGEAIHVRGDVRVTLSLERVLRHELVHAAFHAESPAWSPPGWVNEGCAEWFEARSLGKRHLDVRERSALARARTEGRLPGLDELSRPAFTHLSPERVGPAYLHAYAAVEYLVQRRGERRLAAFLQDLLRLRSPDRALERHYRLDAASLEAAVLAEL
jgi:hypothetical protein